MLPNLFPINMSFFPMWTKSLFYSINFRSSSFFLMARFYEELVYILPLFHSVSSISPNDYMLIGNVLLVPLTDLYYMTGTEFFSIVFIHMSVYISAETIYKKIYTDTNAHFQLFPYFPSFLSCLNTCSDIYLEFLCFLKNSIQHFPIKFLSPFNTYPCEEELKSSQSALEFWFKKRWHKSSELTSSAATWNNYLSKNSVNKEDVNDPYV